MNQSFMWKEQLIALYCAVCQEYHNGIWEQVQRLSNNYRPLFTDEEVMTVYLWGIMQKRFEVKEIYAYTKEYLHDWFPHLPSYSAFDRRLGELSPAFSGITERWMQSKPVDGIDMSALLSDSMPIIVAKGPRSGCAKVAPQLCDKTYNASRKQWYYGVKLHVVAQKRHKTLPFPRCIFVTEASCHDLPVAKEMLNNMNASGFLLLADKAYSDIQWKGDLEENGIFLCTPHKQHRGDSPRLPGGDVLDSSISRARQPIECFFNWINEKTGIQCAAKVRSLKGLLVHTFGRLAAALFLLASPSFNY